MVVHHDKNFGGQLAVNEYADDGKPFEQVGAVGGLIQAAGEILAGGVQHLVAAFLPQEAVGNVVYPALVGDVGRGAVLAVVSGQFLPGEFSHRQPRVTV